MKRPEIEWGLVTLTAAALTAALLVSCAPTHHSFPLASGDTAPPTANQDANRVPVPQASIALSSATGSVIAGDWLCEDDDCAVSKISLRTDGSAAADGNPASVVLQQKGQNTLHVVLSVPAHAGIAATTLAGDVSTSSEIDELPLGNSLYERE